MEDYTYKKENLKNMNKIITKKFDLDEKIIAKSIYWNEKRNFTNEWIEISEEVKEEFKIFLEEYIKFIWLKKTAFFRIDAYFDENNLYILDINWSFVDGWWNALNLTRAINEDIDNILLSKFPENFYLQEEIYRPEFELLISELNLNWIKAEEIEEINERYKTYLYWTESRKWNLFPYDWLRIDNKMNLALFSKKWKWKNIKIPEFTLSSEKSYEDIPKKSVLKVTWKQDIKWLDWKIKIWKPKNWKLASKLWEENKLVVQEIKDPYIDENWKNNQAIFMTINSEPIVWYVQKSIENIINDNSVQWPLIFN